MDIIKVFASNVKRYRKEKGYSQEYLVELCGMHRTYIRSLECCRRSIALENIQRIADALDIETYKLFIESKGRNYKCSTISQMKKLCPYISLKQCNRLS